MNNWEEWIKATHIEIGTTPKPYGFFHLSFVVLSLLLIVAICSQAGKHTDKTFRTVMFCVGAALLLSEGYKQLYYYYAVGDVGSITHFSPFSFAVSPCTCLSRSDV